MARNGSVQGRKRSGNGFKGGKLARLGLLWIVVTFLISSGCSQISSNGAETELIVVNIEVDGQELFCVDPQTLTSLAQEADRNCP